VKKPVVLVLVLVLLLAPALVQAETIYKSVGPDGKITYSQKPPTGNKVEKTLTFANLPSTPLPDSVMRYQDELQKGLKKRLSAPDRRDMPVLFTAVWCGYCKQAKAYLAQNAISYREYDIETPDGARAFAEAGAGRGIPVLQWKGQNVQGFSRGAYDTIFASAK
jgi:glutaredoxin